MNDIWMACNRLRATVADVQPIDSLAAMQGVLSPASSRTLPAFRHLEEKGTEARARRRTAR